jgi:hypothetical protein
VGHLLLFFFRVCLSQRSVETENGIQKIFAVAKGSNLDVVLESFSQEVKTSCLFNYIVNPSSRSGDCEVSVNEEGQILDDPVLSFSLFVEFPLVGVKQQIYIIEMEIFAQESADLSLSPEGIIANDQSFTLALPLLLFVHDLLISNIVYVYVFLTSTLVLPDSATLVDSSSRFK